MILYTIIFILIIAICIWALKDPKAPLIPRYKNIILKDAQNKNVELKGAKLIFQHKDTWDRQKFQVYEMKTGSFVLYSRSMGRIEIFQVESKIDVLNSVNKKSDVYSKLQQKLFSKKIDPTIN